MAKELSKMTKRSEDYSKWYNDLVVNADLAEQAAVRGCMVISHCSSLSHTFAARLSMSRVLLRSVPSSPTIA